MKKDAGFPTGSGQVPAGATYAAEKGTQPGVAVLFGATIDSGRLGVETPEAGLFFGGAEGVP
jgi:hypothetical protein